MYFDIVQSGSKGNATLVFSSTSLILIDMGITYKELEVELVKFNKTYKDIDAVLITHNHADHLKSIKSFSPKKIYALEGTIPGSLSNVVELERPFKINDTEVIAFETSHDAKNPCGYLIKDKDAKLVYMTDTGVYLDKNTPLLKNPDYLIIECNHDIQMLLHTNRPIELKQRIMSEYGHLCNEDSAFATLEIIGDKTKEIILAHISEEANTPECALEAYNKVFKHAHVDINRFNVRVANQHIPLIGGDYEH